MQASNQKPLENHCLSKVQRRKRLLRAGREPSFLKNVAGEGSWTGREEGGRE